MCYDIMCKRLSPSLFFIVAGGRALEQGSVLLCSINQLYAIDTYVSYNFQLVMSLLAMSLGLRFCTSRKGGQGEVGGFQPWAQVTWLLLGLAVESLWLAGHFSPPVHERA